MKDYSKSKIYCIRSPNTNNIYIGSTIQPLSKRFSVHKNKKNKCSSNKILEHNDGYIELICDYPCESKEQLSKKEGEIMRKTDNCINIRIAGRTRKEFLIDNPEKKSEYAENVKKWLEKNPEKKPEYNKKWIEKNPEKKFEYNKEWREKNPNYQKEWREKKNTEKTEKTEKGQ